MGINSKYYNYENFNIMKNLFTHCNGDNQLTSLHINIQSLSAKHEALKELLNTLNNNNINVDLVLLCETFLHEGNSNLFQIPGYNFVFRNRVNMKRGGVAIYIKDTLQYKPRPDLEIFLEGEFETVFIETTNTYKNTIVGSIYRPPNTNIALSVQRFENIFTKLNDYNAIIGTDQNFDLLKIESQH